MKHFFVTLAALLALQTFAHAQEDLGEKAEQEIQEATEKNKEMGAEMKTDTKKAARKTKRMAKKGMHRTEEITCMEGDAQCAAKKAKNRMEEGKDKAVDTMKDTKDQMSK